MKWGNKLREDALKEGEELFAIATGNPSFFGRKNREAVKFMMNQYGFRGVHPHFPDGALWFFETKIAAKTARNRAEAIGIKCGACITRFIVKDGVPEFAGEA